MRQWDRCGIRVQSVHRETVERRGILFLFATMCALLLATVSTPSLAAYESVTSSATEASSSVRESDLTGSPAVSSFKQSSKSTDNLAFVETGSGIFGTIDLNTGAFKEIASNGVVLSGFGIFQGHLYAGTYNVADGIVYSVNTTSGALTKIGTSSVNYSVFGSTATGGVYALSSNFDLYSIDTATGAATRIGATGLGCSGWCNLSSGASKLYYAAGTSLYTIDTSSGSPKLVGDTGGPKFGALVFENDILWGGANSPSLEIASLNISTGKATVVASVTGNGSGNFYALAPDPLPVATTSTTLSASPTSGAYGTAISLTALVKAASGTATPAGKVTFQHGTTALGSVTLNATGQGTFSTKALPVGTDSVNATYSGNSEFDTSTSNTVKVTITGAPVVSLTPSNISFPSTQVGSTGLAQVVSLKNSGTTKLSITSVELGGTNATSFTDLSNCGASLAPGSTCDVVVAFNPTKTGALSAKLSIVDNGAGSPQSVTLTGTGLAVPSLKLSPSSVSFPGTEVGAAALDLTVSVSNSSSTPVTIASISLGGTDPSDFKVLSSCGGTLAAASSCTLYVGFAPRAKGSRTATVSLVDTASDSPQTVHLSGTGK